MSVERPGQSTQPESIPLQETSAERKEREIEAIQEIRNRYGILFITCQPTGVWQALGCPEGDQEWVRKGLGLPEGTDRLKVLRATEESLPDTVPEHGVIIGGSAHSVYEDLPWIKNLKTFIRAMAAQDKPVLGICFGQQLVAEAFGGKVQKGDKGREIGVVNIDLTQEGTQDPLFENVPAHFFSATSHGDVVTDLPPLESTAVLARNDLYPYQALALGDRIRATQFHPEVSQATIESIVRARAEILKKEGIIPGQDLESFVADLREKEVEGVRQRILQNFDRNFIVRFAVKS